MEDLFLEIYLKPQEDEKKKKEVLEILKKLLPYDIAYHIVYTYY